MIRPALLVLLLLAAWELLRWVVLRSAREALQRRARRFAEQHGVRVDLFKFGGKLLVREELLNDLVVVQAMLAAAQAGARPTDVRRRVEEYIDEIVPSFSLAAYFQVGMKLARAAIHAVYKPLIDAQSMKRVAALPPNATAVFLINHRSNFDYVVVGWALARQVAISYAVGEWARVFPLDALFKAFGGFFVRRGFPDPLYHTVLRRYLQLITRRGVTQGIFPEGGLTRDGALRSPKIGLLDAILQLSAEPDFDRELYFVPVGINYDRVLEDESLLAEKRGRASPPTRAEKIRGAVRLLWVLPSRVIVNLLRAATGRLHRSGYVAVAFGEPVRLRALPQARTIGALSDDARRAVAKEIAQDLMARIAQTIPATPVPLVAQAFLEGGAATTKSELAVRVRDLRQRLLARSVPTALGQEFEQQRHARAALAADEDRNRDLARLEADVIELEEAEVIVRLAVERLARRGALRVETGGAVALGPHPHAGDLLAYYARSLAVLEPAATQGGSASGPALHSRMAEATPAEQASPRRLAEFLRERKGDILAEWEAAVRQGHVAQSLDRPVLLDHMPEFVEDLVLYVGEIRAGHDVAPPEQYPRIHALERLEVGYDLAEVVAEYSALRTCITTLFARENPPSLRSVEMPRLHQAIDQAIAASVVRYSEARERTLKALDRISSAALVHHDVATLLPSMLNVLLETTASVDSVAIFLREGDELSVRAAVGLAAEDAAECRVRIGECFAGRIAEARAPLFIRDASHDPTLTCSFLRAPGTHALFGVPLELGGELIGVAIMASRTAFEFSQEDQFLFRTMATRATALLAQANLTEESAARLAELEAVIESISEGVFVGDANGIRRTNSAGLRMLGFDSIEAMQRPIAELEDSLDSRDGATRAPLSAERRPFMRALQGESLTTDIRIRHAKSGQELVLRSASAPIRLGERIIGAVTVNSDITARSREEQELRAALNFRDRVLGVLSHDLRNPLSVVVTSAQMLERAGTLDEAQARSVRRITSNARRIEQLVHDLLDYTRAKQGNGIPVAPRPCDLLQICHQVVDNLRVLHPDRVVRLVAEGDTRGEWDPARVLQVISNLLTNAVRYSPAGTPVHLSLRELRTEVVLEVRNEGAPIPPALLPTIFDAFQRGGPGEAGPGGGIGLGLYIVQQLVAAHGGRVEVHSTAAEGTAFTVHWPRAAKPPAAG